MPQFAIVDPHRAQNALVALVAHWAYFGLFRSSIRNSRLAALPLAKLLCSLGLLRPVSRTARGLRAPHQFPLKSYGFPGAETAKKRFLLWKIGFSAAKISPVSAAQVAGDDFNARGLRPSRALLGFFDSLAACQKSLFDKLVDGGASYPQFAMVVPLRLTACSTPLGFLTV